MNNIQTLVLFFGWCSVINIAILLLSTVILVLMKEAIATLHSKMFGLGQSDLSAAYFQYLGHYKIAILMLNVIPYFALKLMS